MEKRDIKVTILPTFLNEDGEAQQEFFSYYLYGVNTYADPSDINVDNYQTTLGQTAIDKINGWVLDEYQNDEFPAFAHTIEFEFR